MGTAVVLLLVVLCFGQFVAAATLFNLWQSSLSEQERHKQNANMFERMCKSAERLCEDLQAENGFLRRDKERLTQGGARAQDTPRRASGAELRRVAARVNASVPEPTQAERLNSNG